MYYGKKSSKSSQCVIKRNLINFKIEHLTACEEILQTH